MSDLTTLYKEELRLLRESAKLFSDEYPALTSNLVRESQDPDVESILKGVAFLTAQIRREEHDEFPTALQSLSQILAPTQMQPRPSGTILCLTPSSGISDSEHVERGLSFDSVEITRDSRNQKVACRFTNEWPVTLLPLRIANVNVGSVESTAGARENVLELRVDFDSSRADLSTYTFDKLRLYFDLQESDSGVWQRLILESLTEVIVIPLGGDEIALSTRVSSPLLEMSEVDALESQTVMPSRLIGEYISFSEKLNFFDIDFDAWRDRSGQAFSLALRFEMPKLSVPPMTINSVKLYCTPARNRFLQTAAPIPITGLEIEHEIEVSDASLAGNFPLEVVDIERVESIRRDRPKNRKYQNMLKPDSLSAQKTSFYFYRKRGQKEGEVVPMIGLYGLSTLSLDQEVLRVSTQCSNGPLAELIGPGDVNVKTSQTSDLFKFTNLTNATRFEPANIVTNEAWQAISDQSMSSTDLTCANDLRNYLNHHLSSLMDDSSRHKVARHRFNSIEELRVLPIESIIHGRAYFGQEFQVTVNSSHFASTNECYLFGCLLNSVFNLRKPLNSICQTRIVDSRSGEETLWSPMTSSH